MNPTLKLSVSVRSVLSKMLASIGIPEKVLRNRSGKGFVILMYHRVLSSGDEKIPIQPGMYVDPKTFEEHIRYLKQHFRVIRFSEKFSPGCVGKRMHSIHPACILTFDDGWRDFYEYAYPILKRNCVPATVFLPTGYIGTDKSFWPDRLAWLLASAIPPTRRALPGVPPENSVLESVAGLTGSLEKRLESAISMLKYFRDKEIEEVISGLKERGGVDFIPGGRVFLNWEEVREMVGSGLISFGSHTQNHRILVHLEEEEIREELVLSKEALVREGAVDPSFIPFCYPNGDWNDRIARMVRETGYHAAVSTEKGWNPKGASPFDLKRMAIHQDMTASREMFGCRIAEIL
jgi:peptidoglycan/xylan/chitin deacetylase (PgdA/CDA1 family)